jgi:hypothetical protein
MNTPTLGEYNDNYHRIFKLYDENREGLKKTKSEIDLNNHENFKDF